jgi:uncharacterized protein (DUF2062 family)
MNIKRFLKYHYLKFMRLRGSPRSIAGGAAIGAFMAVMPIMPFRTIVIIASTAFTRANPVAALIVATVISNPFTYVPLYFCAVITGNALTPYRLDWESVKKVLNTLTSSPEFGASVQAAASLGLEAFTVLLVGGIAMALPVGLISYRLSLHLLQKRKAA